MKKILFYGVSFIILFSSAAFSQVIISGTVKTEDGIGLNGVTVTFSNGGGTTTTNASGVYSQVLASGWDGTATPSKSGFTFVSQSRNYWNVTTDITGQDFAQTNACEYFSQNIFLLPQALRKTINSIAPIDFNHDGFKDLIVFQMDVPPEPGPFTPAQILAITNDGTGHFVESTAQVLGDVRTKSPASYAVFDFNGDGLDDLFVTDMGTDREPWDGSRLFLFIQKQNGTLADESAARLPPFPYPEYHPYFSSAGDIDGDGDIDIVYNGTGNAVHQLLVNDGMGYFSNETTQRFPAPKANWMANNSVMLDIDSDGDLDIFFGKEGYFYPQDFILLNDGTGYFTYAPDNTLPPRNIGNDLGTANAHASDLNGDGWNDLVLSGTTGAGQGMQLLFNNGNGTFRDASNLVTDPDLETWLGWGNRKITDVNGDGWPDLLTAPVVWPGSYAPHLYINHAASSFEDITSIVWGFHENWGEPMTQEFVDIDNDGDMDVLGIHPPYEFYFLINKKPYAISEPSLPLPDAPTLVSPKDGAIVSSTSVVLTWNPVATAGSYRLQVAMDSGFGTLLVDKQDYVLTTYQLTGLSPNQGYFWRVLAVNTRGAGAWSEIAVFNTNAVILLSPNGGESWPQNSSQTIIWTAAGLAGTMIIELYKNDAFHSTITSVDVAAGSYDWTLPADLLNGDDYKVRIHLGENSDFSDAPFSCFKSPIISGVVTNYGVPVSGVILDGLPGDPVTNASGTYSVEVPYDWSGEVVPGKTGYLFLPTSRSYTQVKTDQAGDFVAYIGVPPTERQALIALYNSTNGDDWVNKTGWKQSPLEADGFGAYGSEGTWRGITVENNTVTYVDLGENNLTGTLPTELGNLTNLYLLRFNNCPLSGPLPDSLAKLTKLGEFLFYGTNLSGPLPSWIVNFKPTLRNLTWASNKFSGKLPNEIGELSQLVSLAIQGNAFVGEIPPSLTNLTKLGTSNLYIGYNGLYASDPALIAFLDAKTPGWASTQTIAPANVVATVVNSTSINLTWDAIPYTSNTGGYRVLVGTAPGGPYTFFQQTTDKSATSLPVTGLNPGTPYYFVIQTRTDPNDNNPNIVDSEYSLEVTATTIIDETIMVPTTPTGPASGTTGTSYAYSTGGSTSNLDHAVQYKIDWDDGSDTGWLASGTTGASHSWTANGTYDVRAMARCVTHTAIESLWSTTHAIIISDSGTLGKYNSPAQQKILPEVIWAAATGGGTWMSEVQVTDISGGSQVSVYYNTAAGRRGPFLLWNNGGGALRSQKYNNLLETIDGLDSGVYTYYGTVGAVEFVTQDAVHVLQVMARTLNGSYSKTFSGLSLHDANTADTGRVMNITNLTSNSTYRSTVGMFNPTAVAVTVELKLVDAANTQIGMTISKTVNGYGFSAFFPFNDAGRPYPAYSYDNVIVRVQPISGSGKVLCFGASANNATNDPAAHLAVQNSVDYDNGPNWFQVLPEAIWAPATGGGTWMSEVQIVDVTGGSAVSFYFDYGGGNSRGPFVLWTGGVAGSKVKYANILQQLGTIDTGFNYYGRVGTISLRTSNNLNSIQVTARTLNGDYSKTFPGLNWVEAETADTSRVMIIQNYASNSTYRSSCGFFNPTTAAVTVEFTLLNNSGAPIGVPFSKTFVGYDFQAFLPFNEAGVPYPANSFDNVILRVRPTSGTGQVICFGASANNASNDPAAHLAVQAQ